jgi:hypothetical protein
MKQNMYLHLNGFPELIFYYFEDESSLIASDRNPMREYGIYRRSNCRKRLYVFERFRFRNVQLLDFE